jgi:hypothetical protein
MKVSQIRQVLAAASTVYSDAGEQEVAQGLAALADLLKVADKSTVQQFASHLDRLRSIQSSS